MAAVQAKLEPLAPSDGEGGGGGRGGGSGGGGGGGNGGGVHDSPMTVSTALAGKWIKIYDPALHTNVGIADSHISVGRVIDDLGIVAPSARPWSDADALFYSKHTVDFTLDGGEVRVIRLRWLGEEVMGPGAGGAATESLVAARMEGAPDAAVIHTPGGDVAASAMSSATPSTAAADEPKAIPMRGPPEDLRIAAARAELRTPESGTSTPVHASNAAAAAGFAARTHVRRPSSGGSMMEGSHQVNESRTTFRTLQPTRRHPSPHHLPTPSPALHLPSPPTLRLPMIHASLNFLTLSILGAPRCSRAHCSSHRRPPKQWWRWWRWWRRRQWWGR